MHSITDLLTNSHLNLIENTILWASFLGSSLAWAANIYAGNHGLPKFRKSHFLISGIAGLYALFYMYLVIFEPPYLEWSFPVRGISILAWFVVWIGPAIISVRTWKELEERVISGPTRE